MSSNLSQIGKSLCDYYASKLLEHGATLSGVDWPKVQDAVLRYSLVNRALQIANAKSVLDVGSGLGHLYGYLQTDPANVSLDYLGVEPIPQMLSEAKKLFPKANFSRGSVEDLSQFKADIVVANGLFTVKHENSDSDMQIFVDSGLEQMWESASCGMVFNLMTDAVENRYPRLFYQSPSAVVERYSKKFGRHFMVFAESRLYDIFYVWLKSPPSSETATPTPDFP